MRERRASSKEKSEKAGCIPIRRRLTACGYVWEVLLVQGRPSTGVWAFPKGTVEDGETPREGAARETLEEAGVTGRLVQSLGTCMLNKNAVLRMWLMAVEYQLDRDDLRWMERSVRIRGWFSLDVARTLLIHHQPRPQLLCIFENLVTFLGQISGFKFNILTVGHDSDDAISRAEDMDSVGAGPSSHEYIQRNKTGL